jgi:hypothetical protein
MKSGRSVPGKGPATLANPEPSEVSKSSLLPCAPARPLHSFIVETREDGRWSLVARAGNPIAAALIAGDAVLAGAASADVRVRMVRR